MNVVIIEGSLRRAPEARTLASGVRLVTYEVAVRSDGRPTESVPVAWFDPPAGAGREAEGTAVVVTGRVCRRFFRTGGVTASRTEVVAAGVLPAGHRKRCAAAVADALAEVYAAAPANAPASGAAPGRS